MYFTTLNLTGVHIHRKVREFSISKCLYNSKTRNSIYSFLKYVECDTTPERSEKKHYSSTTMSKASSFLQWKIQNSVSEDWEIRKTSTGTLSTRKIRLFFKLRTYLGQNWGCWLWISTGCVIWLTECPHIATIYFCIKGADWELFQGNETKQQG